MINRWWIYQKERFPVIKNGFLIATFGISAVCYSLLLRQIGADPLNPLRVHPLQTLGTGLIASIVLFLSFLQLRIADEFKDFRDDLRYRAYRPVPRGLVTLRELGIIGIGSAAIQLGLSLAVNWRLVLLLLVVWGYLGLMSQEFFVPAWLKAKPIAYLLSHMVIMPLMALYATACDWSVVGTPPPGVGWFLVVSFFSGMAIEIGRKIRAPKDEERGVETYTALWGREKALMAWLGVLWLTTLATLLAAMHVRFTIPVALLLMLMLTVAVFVAWRFMVRPVTVWAKRFEVVAGVWTLLGYSSIGIVPWLLRGI